MPSHLFRRNRPVLTSRDARRRQRLMEDTKQQAKVETWVQRRLAPVVDVLLAGQLGRRELRSRWGQVEIWVDRHGVVHVKTPGYRIGTALEHIYGADRCVTEKKEEFHKIEGKDRHGNRVKVQALISRHRETTIQPATT